MLPETRDFLQSDNEETENKEDDSDRHQNEGDAEEVERWRGREVTRG